MFFPAFIHAQGDPPGIDVSLFRSLNNHRSSFVDGVVRVNNDFIYPVVLAAPAGFFAYGLLWGKDSEKETGIVVAVSELVSLGLTHALKRIVDRERPYTRLDGVHVLGSRPRDPYSFPSGYAASAFALATSVSLRYKDPVVFLPLHIWALLVGYGRIYGGVHYPSDILVGAVIGSGTAIGVRVLEEKILQKERRDSAAENGQGFVTRVLIFPSPGGASLSFSIRF